jgi:hypothetical protein
VAPQASANGERSVLPVVNHALARNVLSPDQRTTELVDLMHNKLTSQMSKGGGKNWMTKAAMVDLIKGDALILKGMVGLFDPDTHRAVVLAGRKVQVVDKRTKRLDNPIGPAEINFGDMSNPSVSWSRQGTLLDTLDDYHSPVAEQEPLYSPGM